MGGLTVASFLANNPNINVSGAVLSAPLMNMPKEAGIDIIKRVVIGAMVPVMDNILINPMVPIH